MLRAWVCKAVLGLLKLAQAYDDSRRAAVHLSGRRLQQTIFGQLEAQTPSASSHWRKTFPMRTLQQEV